MLKMDSDRISKIRCYFCGSRDKKVIVCTSNDKRVGKQIVCCSCGNISTFIENNESLPIFLNNQYKIYGGYCGRGDNGCDDLKCPYNKKKKEINKTNKEKQITSVYEDIIERKN